MSIPRGFAFFRHPSCDDIIRDSTLKAKGLVGKVVSVPPFPDRVALDTSLRFFLLLPADGVLARCFAVDFDCAKWKGNI